MVGDSINHDLVFKLWELANATVVFCVGQVMVFIYMAGEGKFDNLSKDVSSILFVKRFTTFLTVLSFVIYMAIIWGCQIGAERILSFHHFHHLRVAEIWMNATLFRSLIVFIFFLIVLYIVYRLSRYGPWKA